MSEKEKTKRLDLPEISFQEVVLRLRLWLMRGNIRSDKVRIEVHFPDEASMAHAFMQLRKEVYSDAVTFSPMRPQEPECFESEGLTVTFSHPDKWDRR